MIEDNNIHPPLRVAQMVDNLHTGGAEQMVVQIANARAEAGDASFLYVLRDGGELVEKVQPKVTLRNLHCQRASVASPFHFLESLRRGHRTLARQIHADGVQVIQSHLPTANFWSLLLAVRHTCAVVPTIHNNEEFSYGHTGTRALLRRRAYRAMISRCNAVVAVSEVVRRSLLAELGLGEEKARRLVTIPNGVEIPEPLPDTERVRVRARFGIRPEELLILGAGRLTEQKNFETLVQALALLRDRGHEFRVIIAGEGHLELALAEQISREQLSNLVLLPGNVSCLPELMLSADLFVLPSLWEGLPLVLLEAMACGLPIAGSRIEGIDEIVTAAGCGMLAEPGDAVSLAGILAELLDTPARRATYGEAGLARVRRDYSFDRLIRQLGELYWRVATGRDPAG